MENYSYHVPFYVVTGGVKTSGHSSELTSGAVGLYDRQTFSVATGIGNGKEFFFAQGNIGGKDWYGNPVTETHKSPFFFGKDIEDMYLSKPQTLVNEEWVIGYNGSASSVTLKYEVGKPIRIKFYFHGQPIYRFFNGPKEYVVSYTPLEDCTQPCNESDCPDAIDDCEVHTKNLIDLINTHVELKKFGVTAKYVHADFSAAATNMTKWCLTLCDNGDSLALQAVQGQAPVGTVVVRTSRSGSQSTYQFCQPDGDASPSDFGQTASVLEAVCDSCPAGSFLIPSQIVYILKRSIVGSEDFSSASSRDDYANTIWTAYASQESITTTTSTTAVPSTTTTTTSATTTTTTSHATTTTTTTVALTNSDATFLGQDGATALVKLKFVAGTDITPLIGTDIIVDSYTEAAQCVFTTPVSTAWTSCGVGIRSSRTMKIRNLNRPDCLPDGDRLSDLETVLAGVVGIDLNTLTLISGDDCKDDYTVEQWSIDCLDEGCLTSNSTFTYDDLPAFENEAWEVVPVVPEDDDTRKCGIRVTAGYIDPKFGDCSFNPMDYYETEPIKMEVSLLQEDGSRCDAADWPTVSQSRVGRISRQTGEYVVREVIMKTDAYIKHIKQFDLEPRMREAFDMNLLGMVDRNAYYDLYYIRYKASYGNSYRKNEQEKFTTVFAFKQGDGTELTFQSNVVDVLTAKSGVVMHIND